MKKKNEVLEIKASGGIKTFKKMNELIKAGATFASSPKRINIHALDPAIIATKISLTCTSENIDLKELLNRTKYGPEGIGGLQTSGMMYMGYPR